MIGRVIATAVIAVFLAATAAFGFGGGGGAAPGIGAPMSTLMPGPPRNVTATAGKGMATVSFDPPKTSSSPVTYYTVTSHPGRISVSGYKSPIVVKGLGSGVTYTFTVSATSVIGTGISSETCNYVTTR